MSGHFRGNDGRMVAWSDVASIDSIGIGLPN